MVIGGGLAGCEAAWQVAQRGMRVDLYEMRPALMTPAHTSGELAEIVCSNSFGSTLPENANGMLLDEMLSLDSLIIKTAFDCRVPAGNALAVDRDSFARTVTEKLISHPLITLHREEIRTIPVQPTVIASGPLTSPALAAALGSLTGTAHLAFFDAVAPIIAFDSVDLSVAYPGARFGQGDVPGEISYINCPFTKQEYIEFVELLLVAEQKSQKSFQNDSIEFESAAADVFFERCLPVETLAARGVDALAWGPMRPTGLWNPHTDSLPYAVLQLRRDNLAGSLFNMVGFQTNLTYGEQKRVFRTIPGLANAEFVRFGHMHRNTFLNAPQILNETMRFKYHHMLYGAGQLVGAEGYAGNAATGLVAGINIARELHGRPACIFPRDTLIGALCHYLANAEPEHFQPMKVNFGLFDQPSKSQARNREKRLAIWQEKEASALALVKKELALND